MSEILSNVQKLDESLLFELRRAMALPQNEYIKSCIRLIFGRAPRKFSELVLGLDGEIEKHGPSAGARWLLPHFVAGFEARGEEIIPKAGPLLIVSNHPASYDGAVISAFINRANFKIIIGEVPPYR
ncbi:MAG: hypothetical protein ACXW4E_04605, partial [Anaerolineales bacterium]